LTKNPQGKTVLPMTTLTFKVTEAEARRIRKLARSEHLTVSEFLRRRAAGTPVEASRPARICCPQTGAMVFAPLANQPPLTLDAVKELMENFP